MNFFKIIVFLHETNLGTHCAIYIFSPPPLRNYDPGCDRCSAGSRKEILARSRSHSISDRSPVNKSVRRVTALVSQPKDNKKVTENRRKPRGVFAEIIFMIVSQTHSAVAHLGLNRIKRWPWCIMRSSFICIILD